MSSIASASRSPLLGPRPLSPGRRRLVHRLASPDAEEDAARFRQASVAKAWATTDGE